MKIIYISVNKRIRKLDNDSGIINTIAGNGNIDYEGDGEDSLDHAVGYTLVVFVETEGNVFFADESNHRIRKFTSNNTLSNESIELKEQVIKLYPNACEGNSNTIEGVQIGEELIIYHFKKNN